MSFNSSYAEQMRSAANEYAKRTRAVHKHTLLGGLKGAATGAAIFGGVSAAQPLNKDEEKSPTKSRFIKGFKGAVGGALLGGYAGSSLGHAYGDKGLNSADRTLHKVFKDRRAERFNAAKHMHGMGFSGKEKTRAEAEKVIKQHLAKAHPDRGGSHDDFIKAKRATDAIKKSHWFSKLASNLPMVVKQTAKNSAKVQWKPSLRDHVREFLHVEPELKKIYKAPTAIGAASGAVSGLAQAHAMKGAADSAHASGKISKDERDKIKKKYGYGKSMAMGTALGGVASGATTHLLRNKPNKAILSGVFAGGVAPALQSLRHANADKGEKATLRHHQEMLQKVRGY